MKNIAIFASGSGTNFQAIVDANQQGKLDANIKVLICDKPQANCIKRAVDAAVPSFVFNAKEFASKEEYEKKILQELQHAEVEFIVLAGYMRLIGSVLLQTYAGRIVNVHPSLLPAFPGKDAIGQALEARAKATGVTIHYVDEGMDTGPIIDQYSITMDEDETKASLQNKIHEVEHQFYPMVLNKLLNQ
ncbi:phosphoribosylglycinamide formyltransferase [Cytobacillus purgationiresistens]|uniref:Phosphoribosylglycinamide formyltransferase n=1 Tax=Cytobacillus purgationiresistens TaxID=863449 RepID=A0ABU0AP19_9BACI|nr:phosphoribosylglycinamide formyltransferase [Cytobacillus purgationiresistens]MDQ0272935.1 phosphoribosylglycinamide formyltransferase-1 [Cytobacillus purgationiresistens]